MFCLLHFANFAYGQSKSVSESGRALLSKFLGDSRSSIESGLAQEISFSGGSSPVYDENIKTLIEESKSLISNEQLNSAAEKLMIVLEIQPENLEANGLLGATFLALKSPDLAEGFLYSAVRISQWKDITSISNLAESLRLNKDLELAEKVAQKALQADNGGEKGDETGVLCYVLGAIHQDKKNYKLAADWYLSAAVKLKTNEDAWLRASTLMFPAVYHDLKFAENVLVEAARALPERPRILHQLALVLYRRGSVENSVSVYQESIRLDSSNGDVWGGLATALHALNRRTEAVEAYLQATKINPSNVVLLANFSRLLVTMGNRKDALEVLLSAKRIDTNHPEVIKAESIFITSS